MCDSRQMFGDVVQHEQARRPKHQVDIEDGHNPHQNARLVSQKNDVNSLGLLQKKWQVEIDETGTFWTGYIKCHECRPDKGVETHKVIQRKYNEGLGPVVVCWQSQTYTKQILYTDIDMQ